MSQLPELLPCPFCGLHLTEDEPSTDYYTHKKSGCILTGVEFDFFDDAEKKKWNTRAIGTVHGIGQSVDKAPVHIDNTAIQVDRSTELQRNVADLWTTGKDWKK